MPAFRGPDGKVVYVPEEEASRYRAGGDYQEVGGAAAGAAQSKVAPTDNGVLGSLGATISGALSGATLGASDIVLKGALSKGQFAQLAQDRADNPVLGGTAQAAGMILPALVSGGAATPAGALGKLAGEGIEAGRATGGALGAAQQLGAAGAEGAIANAGIYLSDVALGDRDLTAEGINGALGTGLLFGAGGIPVAHGIEAGTIAARRMFARYASGGAQAASDAAAAWTEQAQRSLESFDQAADLAKAKLAEAQTAREAANLQRLRAGAEMADARVFTPPAEFPGAPAGAPPTPGAAPEVTAGGAAAPAAPVPGEPPEVAGARVLRDRAKAMGGEPITPDEVAALEAKIGKRTYSSGPAAPPPGPLEALAQQPGVRAAGPATAVREYGLSAVPIAADEADLGAKLGEYQAARQAFNELHAQVDPDLDAALRGIEPADVQRQPVPVGEFGAPGARGIKSPEELAAKAAGESSEPRFAGGTPQGDQPGTMARGPRALRSLGEVAAEQAPVPIEPGTAVGRRPAASGEPSRGRIEVNEIGRTEQMRATMPDGSTRDLGKGGADTFLAEQMPPGFRPAKVQTHRRFAIEHGLPSTAADVAKLDENAIYIAKPSELADRDIWGNEIKDANRDLVLNAWEKGEKLPPVDAYVTSDGRIYIDDGNHRVQAAAIDGDRPIAIRFRDGTNYDPQRGARDISDRIRKDLPKGEAGSGIPDHATIQAHEAKVDDYLERTVPAREVAARGYYEPPGGGTDAVRVDNARKAIRDGQREAIKLNVSPEGKITVTDGRHRLAAAIEADASIKVKWSTGTEPAESDVLRGASGLGAASDAIAQHGITARIERLPAEATRPERIYLHLDHPDGGGLMLATKTEGGDWEIGRTTLDPKFRGEGVGTAMYKRMNEIIEAEHGKPLMSALPKDRSKDAERVWQQLEKKGLARRMGPEVDGRPERWVMTRGKPTATDTLTGQLRGTAAKIGEGQTIGRIGAESPARAAYVADKAERTAAAAEHFRAKATGSDLDSFFRDLTAPKTRDAYVAANIGRAMREEGSHAAALAKVEREWAERTATEAWAERAAVLEYEGGYSRAEAERMARDEVEKATHGPGSEPPPVWESKKNPKRTEAAKKAAAASVERLHEIHSAVASNLPEELQTAWNEEGYKFLREESSRIRGVKDRISAASKISEAFTEKYGSASETVRGYEGDRFHRRAEIEANHAESWANEQERRYYARGEHPLDVKRLEMAHDEALERAATAADPAERAAAAREAQVIERQITQVGARPGAVEDIAALAPAVTRVEKAAAALTEALGDAAPAAAKEHAAAFRAAEDEANRKMTARIGKAADDAAGGAAPAGRGPLAPKAAAGEDLLTGPSQKQQRIAAAQKAQREAGAAYAKAQVSEAEAKIAAKQATGAAAAARAKLGPPPGAAAAPAGKGVGHRIVAGAHAAGYAAELGSDLGIPGIPRPHDIPVIGPLLSAYLKYRAFRAAAGRFMGRVPATAEAHAAALAAKTRDGMARAVDRSLGLVERNVNTVRAALTIGTLKATDALGKRLIDDGGPDAKDGASVSEQAAVRMREIAAVAANPALITQTVRAQSRALTDPDLIDALSNHLMNMFQHLNQVMPKGPPPNPFTGKQWVPSPADAMRFGQQVAIARDPQVALSMLDAGTLTPAGAATLQTCYQLLFKEGQARIMQRATELKNPVAYPELLRLGRLFDVPTHPSLDPQNAAALAMAHTPAAKPAPNAGPPGGPPTPSIANPTSISKLYDAGGDRQAGRI